MPGLSLLAVFLYATGVLSQKVIDLSSIDWTLENLPLNISVPGSVPSQVHLDLYAARVIGDPYYGLNDFSLRWITQENWTYTADVPGLDRSSNLQTWLLFNGLDTFTSIEFCGRHVAATNNHFRQYSFDISAHLKDCTAPTLSINFGSAPTIADKIAALPGQETWPFGVEIIYEFPNRQFIRKEQSDFGWDWGPAFAPAGIWQPAYVIQLDTSPALSEVLIKNSDFDISRLGQVNNIPPDQNAPWLLNASLDVLGTLPPGAKMTYSFTDSCTNQTVSSGTLSDIMYPDGSITGTTVLDPSIYDLWWPRGLGPQNLYNLTIGITDASNKTIASINKRTGFRTIVLNLLPISDAQIAQGIAPGNNWHFEINGHEFYAKGSNFIPPDAFWPRISSEKVQQLFNSVTAANQNMLRVWASGAYTPDFIYDIADREGILMWSEFEFGDALYPVDQEFIDNVIEEATYNVRRVNHHPSLALWAGGNELESLELSTINETAPELFGYYQAQYEQLFLHTLLPIVYENSKSISYIPSSTTNGYLDLGSSPQPMVERYNNKTPGFIYGDTDYYNYDSALAFNTSSYPVGRFANEFGYHSMPSLQSWQQVLPPSELYFNSTTIQLRNHHYPPGGLNISNFANTTKGMGEMTVAAERWYPVPNKSEPTANFSAWCHTTQIFQADFYKSEIQFYRRGSGFPNRNLGSLYWQLEDIWQAPSWAGIEYDGRWKVLHYIAKDIYRPLIISPFYSSTTRLLSIYVTSDLWSPSTGTVSFEWFTWTGEPITMSEFPSSVAFTVGGLNTTKILDMTLDPSVLDFADAVLYMSITTTGRLPNTLQNTTFTHDNYFHAAPLSHAKLSDPGLTLTYNDAKETFTIEATTGVSVWTWLNYPAGAVVAFDTNAFFLRKGEKREVGYTIKSDGTGGGWSDGVTVESLWDNTVGG